MTPGGPLSDGAGEPADRDPLSHIFAGPTDDERARLRADLLARAAQVQAHGWEPYRGLWSTGEVIGVAVLLGEQGELTALGETPESARERWAFDLWGLDGGQADVDNSCEATRQWFLAAANEFNADIELRGLLARAAKSSTVRRTRRRHEPGFDREDGAQ
jgi:hypothetical protein